MNTRISLATSAAAIVLTAVLGATAVAAAPPATDPGLGVSSVGGCTTSSRGRLLATAPLVELSRADVATELADVGLPGDNEYGVTTHSVRYCTITPAGRPTTASGLVALPRGMHGRLPLVIYAHSTAALRTAVPSYLGGTESRLVPLFFASAGFALVAPDYLGLGTSPGAHPYLHAATEASATLDLLEAADKVSRPLGVRLSRTAMVSGHSQGGQATMAIGRAIDQDGDPWQLGALAPMAGPYHLSETLPAVLDPARTDPDRAAAYLAYLFTSWKPLYNLYADPREVFTAPYADLVEGLFDGTRDFDEIQAALPSPSELLRPETLALVAHPTGRLAAALRENEVCDWAPAAPTRLYVGQLDTDVVPANTDICRRQIVAAGGTATIVDLGAVDHLGTAIAALPLIRAWFSQL